MTFMYNAAVMETDRGCLKYLSRMLKEVIYLSNIFLKNRWLIRFYEY